MKCDIIIPVWNQLEFTKKCIESVFRNTNYAFRLVVIDNGSAKATRAYLDELARDKKTGVTVLRNNENLGFIKATNQGIRESDAPYVCLLNNDTEVTKGWLKEMVNVAEKKKDIGIVNANSNTLGCKAKFGQSVESLAEELRSHSGEYSMLAQATGFCMLIKREIIDKVGIFDETYGMGNFEDADFSKRAQRSGYSCVCARASYVYHRERRSFVRFRKFDQDFDRNREIFYSKWGRQERILYVLSHSDSAYRKEIGRRSLKLARDGNIVWIFSKGCPGQDIERHSNIYSYSLPKRFFGMISLWRILKRKKKFDKIYVDDENYGKRLGGFKFFHKAEVIRGC
ncbi:MAG: glycosyltransferase family 2 protein [Candidatus Gorgyraea atricola]|nr:glycosyltransferase family 2 protein [Candidatus Gorgyraea atricola]